MTHWTSFGISSSRCCPGIGGTEPVADPDAAQSGTLSSEHMKLSREHLDRFVERGYVVVEGALSDADLQPVIDDYAAIGSKSILSRSGAPHV